MTRKKVKFLPSSEKIKRKKNFSVNTKNISSHVLEISEFSLVLRTREITDIFNTFDRIYLVFTSKKQISSISDRYIPTTFEATFRALETKHLLK